MSCDTDAFRVVGVHERVSPVRASTRDLTHRFVPRQVCRRVTWLIHECAFIRVTWLSHVCDMTHWHMWRDRLVARYHLSAIMSQASSYLSFPISHVSSLMIDDGAIRVAHCEMIQDGGLNQSGDYCRERKCAHWASHWVSWEWGWCVDSKKSQRPRRSLFPFIYFKLFLLLRIHRVTLYIIPIAGWRATGKCRRIVVAMWLSSDMWLLLSHLYVTFTTSINYHLSHLISSRPCTPAISQSARAHALRICTRENERARERVRERENGWCIYRCTNLCPLLPWG